MFDQMSREIAIGIQAFFHDIFADFAVVNTGDRISATTAGRIPLKMRVSVSLFLIVSGVRNIAMARIIRNDGRMVPRTAKIEPQILFSL